MGTVYLRRTNFLKYTVPTGSGDAGFLGSHLYEKLIVRRSEVICIDNFFIGRRYYLLHLFDHPHF